MERHPSRRADRGVGVPTGAGIIALLVLALAACEGAQAPEDADPSTVASSEVHVLGSSESIDQVRDLEVLPDGSVWVLNSVETFFVGFDTEGDIVGQHGAAGGGPEEFRMPAGLLTGGLDGAAWTLDVVHHAFVRVSEPDEKWTQVAVPREEIPPGSVRGAMHPMRPTVRTARLGDEIIIPWTTETPEAGWPAFRMALLRPEFSTLNPRTGAVRDVVALGDVFEDPSADFVATAGGFPLWYRLWAVCDDHLRVYDRVRNQLRGFTGSGSETDPIDLPPVRLTAATPLEFARAVFPLRQAEATGAVGTRLSAQDSVRLLNQMAQNVEGSQEELAAYLPRYVDFRCSDDGTMWMQPVDLEVGGLEGGPAWLRITPDGDVHEIRLPGRFDALRFTRDRIWGVQRDTLDVASLAWIGLPVGE